MFRSIERATAALAAGLCLAGPAWADVNAVVVNAAGGAPDYANAKAETMPTAPISDAAPAAAPPFKFTGAQAVHLGKPGTGVTNPVQLSPPKPPAPPAAASGRSTLAYGLQGLPFNTARVTVGNHPLTTTYPFSAIGKLFFITRDGSSSHCSASLIGPGLVITAAHCLTDYGSKTMYTGVRFAPGFHNGTAPFGAWSASQLYLPDQYLNGTGDCTPDGIVCKLDVALVTLLPSASGALPGPTTGVLSYGLNGVGFVDNKVLVTQLGYPANLDQGERMERNDAQGHIDAAQNNNTIIGSLMSGGASGGPWVVNFGESPNDSTPPALGATRNMVVGVTSYGATSPYPKYGAASPLTTEVFSVLYGRACAATPAACN